MPAQGSYCHIYNRGVDNRIIFNDQEDYRTFIGFLKGYLSTPLPPESTKEEFKVNGKVFRGIPHQPKNYFNHVELIAYNLKPDRFHLLLSQQTPGSLERFMGSLSTRYSIYFNKKYHRTGSLFVGSYKSLEIKDHARLLLLTHYFHYGNNVYSSYKEFIGLRNTSWVKPKAVLDHFQKAKGGRNNGGVSNYQYFIEEYSLDQKEKEALEKIIIEGPSEPLNSQPSNHLVQDPDLKPLSRIPELIAAGAIFLLLYSLGLRNINVLPEPSVSGVQDEKALTVIRIKTADPSAIVEIHKKPSITSEKVGEAKGGDALEFASLNSDWYEVRFGDGSTGFILSKYVE